MPKSNAEMVRDSMARKRQWARETGLCCVCCKQRPNPERAVCASCNAAVVERKQRKRERDREAANIRSMIAEHERAGDEAFTQHFYDDAVRHFEAALEKSGIENADRLRLAEKLASVFFFSGDPDRANPWMERILEGYLEADAMKEKAIATLTEISVYRWLDCQTKAALPFVAQALRLAETDLNSHLYKLMNLIMVARLLDLGHYDEAKKFLEAAGEITSQDTVPLPQLFSIERAICAAAVGKKNEAFASFEEAVQRAEVHPDGGYRLTSVLDDYGLWATALGKIEVAKMCHKRALFFAQQHQILWRIPYLSLRYADLLARMGQYESAYEYLNDALSYDIHVPRVAVMTAFVGIPIALHLNDNDLLQRCAQEPAIELVFQSGENMLIGRIVASFARFFTAQGRLSEAQVLIHRALGAIRNVDLHWELPLAAAQFGTDTDVGHARALLEQRAALPCADVVRAFLLLFDAIITRRRGRIAESRVAAAIAAEQFTALQWHGYVAHAREMIHPSATLRTLVQPQAGVKKYAVPSIMLPALTLREQQVAKLVSKGLTNRAIAAELSISENTVETHMTSIMSRWGIRSRYQLVDLLSEPGR